MEVSMSIKWSVCRLCLQEGDARSENPELAMRCIYDDPTLVQRIYAFTGVKVEPKDNAPDKACKKCIDFLNSVANFANTCRESEEYVASMIRKTQYVASQLGLEHIEVITADKITADKESAKSSLHTLEFSRDSACLQNAVRAIDAEKGATAGDPAQVPPGSDNSSVVDNMDLVLKNFKKVLHFEFGDEREVLEQQKFMELTAEVLNEEEKNDVEEDNEFELKKTISSTTYTAGNNDSHIFYQLNPYRIWPSEYGEPDEMDEFVPKNDGVLNAPKAPKAPQNVNHLHEAKSKSRSVSLIPLIHRNFADARKVKSCSIVGSKPESFVCPVCGNLFGNATQLGNHMRQLHTGQNFDCKLCRSSFSDSAELTSHMDAHVGERRKN